MLFAKNCGKIIGDEIKAEKKGKEKEITLPMQGNLN